MSIRSHLLVAHRELILYGLIGCICSSLDFVIYTSILYLLNGKYVLFANTIGVLSGIVLSFLLNRHFTFKVKDHTLERFVKFLAVGLIGLAVSTCFIYLMVDIMGWNKIYSKLGTIVFVAIVQFTLNKLITFKIR